MHHTVGSRVQQLTAAFWETLRSEERKTLSSRTYLETEVETDRESEVGIPQLNCIVFETPTLQFLYK